MSNEKPVTFESLRREAVSYAEIYHLIRALERQVRELRDKLRGQAGSTMDDTGWKTAKSEDAEELTDLLEEPRT